MVYSLLIGIFSLGLSLSTPATAEVMFEGYSTVRSGQTTIGYTILRYEFDAKKKQFTSTSFLKTNAAGNNVTESLKAVSNDKFQPISYSYTTKVGDTIKTIDAKFANNEMTATVGDGKTSQKVKVPVKKGTFLSTFLGYLMLQNGYKIDKKFTYSAIAEEDGAAYSGEAFIKAEEDFKGQKTFRILNTFKGAEFVSFVNPKGEVIGTVSPLQDISTELMATAAEATKGMVVPSDALKTLFGSVPAGKVNSLANKANTLSAVPAEIPYGAPASTGSAPTPSVGKAAAPQDGPPAVKITPPKEGSKGH